MFMDTFTQPTWKFGDISTPWSQPTKRPCTCRGPWMIFIPAGKTVTITCPQHGDVVMHGPNHTM